jgi:hypothetical protein
VTRSVGRMQTGLLGINGLVMVVALLILLILIAIGVI